MRGMLKKILAFALAASFLFYVMPDIRMVARANTVISEEDFVSDGNGPRIFEINGSNITTYANLDNVTIPSDCELAINDVSVNGSLSISGNGQLSILGSNGKFAGTISAADGARLMLESKENKPSEIDLYDQGICINGDGWRWVTFEYDDNVAQWNALPPMGSFQVRYDDRAGEAGVYWSQQSETLLSDTWYSYIDEENTTEERLAYYPINLTIKTPSEIEKTDILMIVNGVTFYEGGNYGTIPPENTLMTGIFPYAISSYFSADGDGYLTFSHTPTTDDPLDIEVYWLMGEGGGAEEQLSWDRLKGELNASYFAFGDIDNSGTTDTEDLKYGIARTLYDGFKVCEGRYQREGAALGLAKQNGDTDTSNFNSNMSKLLSMMSVGNDGNLVDTIPVTNKAGTEYTLSSYQINMTINTLYGINDNGTANTSESEDISGNPIVLSAKVYLIDETYFAGNSEEQVIIKVKNKYFIRDAYQDRDTSNTDDLEQIAGSNARALVIVGDFNSKADIVAFGNFAHASEEFSDESTKDMYASGLSVDMREQKYLGDKFVVMKPSFTGITINGSGETNVPLAWSSTGSYNVVESNSQRGSVEQELYFGFTSATINPITKDELSTLGVKDIASVTVMGNIPTNAVSVDQPTTSGGDAVVHFHSNYYDSVELQIVYNMNDGSTKTAYTTIHRVGIVIDGGRTNGFDGTCGILHGHDDGGVIGADGSIKGSASETTPYGSAVYATYYYPTDSAPASADVSLFVTITYTNGTVEKKIVPSTKFTAASSGNTAMSDYVLYVGTTGDTNYPVKVEAIAVPNADASGRFVGAKLGAGRGVSQTFDWTE